MKKITQLCVLMLTFLMWCGSYAQVASYGFSHSIGTFTPNGSNATIVSGVQSAGAISKSLPIGFTFVYGSKSYTNFKMTSEGYLTFDTAATTFNATNDLGAATNSRSFVAPLWDNLNGTPGIASYQLTGSSPNRVLTVEWLEWGWTSTTAAAISFQVKLYETTNVIEFVYKHETAAPSSASATIGLSDEKGSGSGTYLNVNSNLTTPTVTSTTSVTNINTKPADNQVFKFTPPPCLYKGIVTVANITGTTATLNLSVPSSVKIDVYVSNSGAPAPGATPTHTIPVGTTSLPLTGLSPSSSYTVYFLYTCSDGTVIGWFEYLVFNTVCGISTGFFEGFENAATGASNNNTVPVCWTYIRSGGTSGYGYTRSNYAASTKNGKNGFYVYTYNADVMLVSPETNNLGGGTKQVRFSVNEEYLNSTTAGKITVYSLDGNTAAANRTAIQVIPITVKGWVEYVVPLPNTTDDYFGISFTSNSSTSMYPHLDDIYYEDLSPCIFPTNIAATPATITTTGATITWTASTDPNTTGYEYEVRTSGAPGTPGAVATGTSATNSAVVGPLASGTKYTVYVRSICNGSPGPWTMFPGIFNTLCDVVPGNFFEGFENAQVGQWNNHTYPDCWTYINSNQANNYPYGFVGQYNYYNGNRGYDVYTYNQGNSPAEFMLISPQTNNLGNGTKQVRFYVQYQYSYGGTPELELYTLDSNTATATKTLVQKITFTNAMQYNWVEFVVPLPPTTDDYFAFSFPKGKVEAQFSIDDIYYEDLLPCIFPTGVTVSNITTTSASAAWMGSLDPNATGYEYEVVDANGTVVSSGSTTGTSVNLSGLTSATKYYLKLRSVCGGSTGDWSSPVEFITLCDIVTGNFLEDFESTAANEPAPLCWTLINTDTANYANTYVVDWWMWNSPKSYYVYRDMWNPSTGEVLLISPETANLGNGTKQVRFSVGNIYGSGSIDLKIYTLNSNTASATKTLVQTVVLSPGGGWKEYSVPLPATADDYFAFEYPYMPQGYYEIFMDDVYYEDAPPCSAPGNIVADPLTITTTSATVTWNSSQDPGVTAYEYEVRTSGAAGSGATGLVSTGTTTSTSVNLTGLTASTNYTVYVRAICGGSTIGDWTKDPGQFYTQCDIVTGSFFEGFENTPSGNSNNNTVPYCWTYAANIPSSAYGYTDANSMRTGSKGFFVYRYNYTSTGAPNPSYQGDMLLISPQTDDLGKGTKRLRFWARMPYSGTSYLTSFEVYSMDGNYIGANKTLLSTINLTTTWQEYIVYFPVNTTDDYFAFSFPNQPLQNLTLYANIDDINYEDIPSCVDIDVNNITVNKITKTGFTVNWKDNYNNGAAYEVEVRTDNALPGTPGAIYNTTTTPGALSAVINGLNSSTEYKIYVRAVCNSTDKSVWNKGGIGVKTLCDYPNITSHTLSAVYCGPQKADLTAEIDTPNGVISWYDKEEDEESLFDGENFISDKDVTQDRSFWLRSRFVKNDTLVKVGYGTSTGTTLATFLNGSYSALKHQHIFTAQELKNAGLGAGPITALQFDIVTTGTRTRDSFTISMGATTQSVATATLLSNTTLQQVYNSGKTQKFTVGLMTFNFSTPFIWDGKSNVVVQTNWSNEASGATAGALRYHTTPINMTSVLYTSDASVSAATMLNTIIPQTGGAPYIYTTVYNQRPNIGFVGTFECKSNAIEIPIKIEPKPLFELSNYKVTSCEGDLSEKVTITTNLGGYDTFVWTPSIGVSGDAINGWTFSTSQEQEYVLSASQSNGICEHLKTVRVFAAKKPEVNTGLANTYDLCKNEVQELKALDVLPVSVNIGTGLSTTLPASPVSAFVQSAVFSKQQYIYSAAELIAQGFISSGYISNLSFETIDSGASLSNAKYTIKMMSTPNTSFGTTTFEVGDFATVYSKDNHTHTFQGVQTITLDSPFFWDGQSNILVEITQEGIGNGNNAQTYYTTVTGVNVGMFATSDTDENPIVGTPTANRLNIKFGIKQSTVTWQPSSNLYVDAAATIPYIAGTNALKVYVTSGVSFNQMYNITLTSPSGCALSKPVTVNFEDVLIPVIQNQTFCQATPVSSIVVTGGSTAMFNYYNSATATTPMTTISQTGTYYVEAVQGICKSPRVSFTVTITPLSLPTAQFTQVICGGGTVSALMASGVNGAQIRWYASATSTTPLAGTQALVDNTTYYASQILGTCESGRVAVLVDINTIPPALTPQTISICGSLTYAGVNLNQMSGSELVWYASATSQTPIPNTGQIVNGTYYVSQKVNGCESLRVQIIASSQGSVAAPTATIQNICGSGTVAQLVAQILPNAIAEWYISATATTPLASTAVLVNGTYYLSQRVGNCVSARVAVAVRVISTSAPAVSSISMCEGSKISDLNLNLPTPTGVSYNWYLNSTSTTPLPLTDVLQSGHYFVTRVENGCESGRTQVQVTINTRPNSPLGASPQLFENYAEISNLIMDKPNVVWYATYDDAMKGINPLAQNMPLVTGTTYYAVIIGANGCSSLPTPIEAKIVLGVNDFDLSKLKYYPNPVNDLLTITYTDAITNVEVFDLNGRMVLTRNFDNQTVQLDFSTLSSGTYMLNIKTKENSQFVKIVKK